ncbi:hypothetical protein C5O18_04780 [Amnimonas aquatica]|uniref:Uncharacterized protein n=2 Tax=Amnimonas aquatica TaxID=2094561 RepID=A0A2P6ASZ4_9GAMM|nr:hypothetical protein C5O18_04780 [Amnimonas aquatica]
MLAALQMTDAVVGHIQDAGAMRTKVKIRTAPGLLLSLMSLLGKSGLATPWDIIYVVPGRHRDRRLIAAKMKRIEQIERRGLLLFMITYVLLLFRHGYRNHPYEVEARVAGEDDALRIY